MTPERLLELFFYLQMRHSSEGPRKIIGEKTTYIIVTKVSEKHNGAAQRTNQEKYPVNPALNVQYHKR